MNMLVSFCRKLHLGRAFAIFAAGFVLVLNVACSNGNDVGARPHNPPVQMGGQNNPHKVGGDGYSEYQMTTDPAVKTRDRASVDGLGQLIAASDKTIAQSRLEDSNRNIGDSSKQSGISVGTVKVAPEPRQEVIDRSDPNAKLLEKAGRTFSEAGKHLTGSTDRSIETGIKYPSQN